MSDKSPILAENLPTITAVAAVLAILGLAFSGYLHRELEVVAVGAAALDVKAARRDAELEGEIKALTTRVATLEAAAAPPAPVADATPPAEPAAPAK